MTDFGSTLLILTSVVGSVIWTDRRHREDASKMDERHREDQSIMRQSLEKMDATHREDMKVMNDRWASMYQWFDMKLDHVKKEK